MSNLNLALFALGCALIATAADAAAKASFNGCPVRGVEAGCIVVKSGGKVYDVTAAKPAIQFKGLGVSGSGTVSGDPNTCMQGVRLKDIRYTYTKMKCAKPKDGTAKK